MLQKFASIAAWASLAVITFATLSPADLRPTLTTTEPGLIVLFEHVAAFAVLGVLFSMGYPRRYRLVCALVFGSAIVLELLQIIVPDRDARVIDAIEKLAGGGAGIFAAQWLLAFVPARKAAGNAMEDVSQGKAEFLSRPAEREADLTVPELTVAAGIKLNRRV